LKHRTYITAVTMMILQGTLLSNTGKPII